MVTTTVMALGSRKLAKKDAIVAKLSAIEEMAGMNMLCSDKTGNTRRPPPISYDSLATINPPSPLTSHPPFTIYTTLCSYL